MADPQLEKGFTRIADELLEALAVASLSSREIAIVLAVMRKTYGFQKKTDRIAASQLSEMTRIPTSKIWGLVAGLEKKKVLTVVRPGRGKMLTLSVQKDHSRWEKRRPTYPSKGGKQHTPFQAQTYPLLGSKLTPSEGVHKRERDTLQERKEERGRSVEFGNLVPLLSSEEVDAWVAMKPGGRTYSRDEVQAFYLFARPALVADDKDPRSGARKMFASANPGQIKQAVLWVETQTMEALNPVDDRELDSFEDIAEAFNQ